jgi:hypothetical protein
MSISPEDTTVGSRLNIHVIVIVFVGVSVNKRFIPLGVEEYIIVMNRIWPEGVYASEERLDLYTIR